MFNLSWPVIDQCFGVGPENSMNVWHWYFQDWEVLINTGYNHPTPYLLTPELGQSSFYLLLNSIHQHRKGARGKWLPSTGLAATWCTWFQIQWDSQASWAGRLVKGLDLVGSVLWCLGGMTLNLEMGGIWSGFHLHYLSISLMALSHY